RADDEAKEREITKRFPDGCLAHSELLRQTCLDDSATWGQAAAENFIDEAFADLFAKDPPFGGPWQSGGIVFGHRIDRSVKERKSIIDYTRVRSFSSAPSEGPQQARGNTEFSSL